MNFLSYVAELSRGWDEPNARDMGRMTSQPNAKAEMYILKEEIDMKAKIAAMARRLEELEMKKMQEMQAISQTPLQAMPWAIYLSYEHLVEECPTIPVVREMFGDCNTYNSNWRDHPNFSWKPQPPQYQQPAQAPQQASNLEQAIANLSKVGEDFVGAQKSINAQLSQRIDSVESSLNKMMDEIQNDLSQKIDNLQCSISRLTNLKAHKRESSQVRDVKAVITLRSGKEVDLATSKQEHETENETEKKNREEIKGKRKGIVSIAIIQCKSLMKDANFIWDPGKLKQDNIFFLWT
ncbi:hypothetical protein CK203_034245 [Vitis vinifera]|uniref:Uncharacterized protein n=1 Tax=Vitis vinifera TaxID=29760 RepID=A0A438INN6_VITVI|nr:hypothetical protein CK203_034245 [Vitis vinifera]